MKQDNYFRIEFTSRRENIELVSATVEEFIRPLEPSKGTITDIKVAIGEAVENAIIHAYHESETGKITVRAMITEDGYLQVKIRDWGYGLHDDVAAGNGFNIMYLLMDEVKVKWSHLGTVITLIKKIE